MSSNIVTNTSHSNCASIGEKIYLSALILAVIAAVTAIFVMHFHASLILSEKFVIPILAGYSIASALSIICLFSLIFQKKAKEVLPDHIDSPQTTEITTEQGEEEIETVEIDLGEPEPPPFLDFDQPHQLDLLKKEPNLETENKRIALRKRAKQKLVEAKKYSRAVDWRQFAHMNNTSLIKNSSFGRGNYVLSCLTAYLGYLGLLKKEGPFFSFEDCDQLFQDLEETLAIAKSILACFPQVVDGFLDEKELIKARDKILKIIEESLIKKGHVYLPLGYCGRGDQPGHAIVGKIARDLTQQMTTVSFLNLGEGVGVHPELEATSNQIKTSYSYYPAVLPSPLWSQIAPAFMAHVLRFNSDLPIKGKCYTSQDFYDLLAVLQSFSIEYIIKHAESLGADIQDVGDCTEKAVRNTINDFLLIEKSISHERVNTLFLNLHFASIVAAYYSYMDSPQEDHRDLLIHACEEFSQFLLRSKSVLKEEDYLETAEMIDIVLHEVNTRQLASRLPLPPCKVPASTLFPQIDTPKTLTIDQIKKGTMPTPKIFVIPPFKASTFKEDLAHFMSNQELEHYKNFNHHLVAAYISSLPIPKWGEDDEWNKIPKKDIPEILIYLKQFMTPDAEESQEMLAAFTLYAIADKLVRLADVQGELKKGTFPFPIQEIEQYLFFPLGTEERRFQEVKNYFSSSHAAAKGKIISFPNSRKILSFLKDEKKVSPELQSVFYFAAIVMKLTQGKNADSKKIPNYTSWNELQKAEDGSLGKGSLDRRLMKFFLKYQDFTTNDVLCKPKNFLPVVNNQEQITSPLLDQDEQKQISKELLDELMLLMRNPKLQFGLTVQWIQGHFNELNKEVVQKIIEFALFSSLRTRHQDIAERVLELRALIEKGFIYYGDTFENTKGILFLIRCGLALESYMAEFSSLPIDQRMIEKYQSRLQTLQSLIHYEGEREHEDLYYVDILAHRQFLEMFTEKKTADHFIEYFTLLFKYGTITYGLSFNISSSLKQRLSYYRRHCFEQFQQFLDLQKDKKQEVLDHICNSVIHNLTKRSITHLSWHFHPSSSTCISTDFVFEFSNGSIHHGKSGHALISPYKYEREKFHHQSEYGIDPQQLWWMAHTETADESSRSYEIRITFDESTILVPDYWNPYLLKDNGAISSKSLVKFEKEDYETLPFLRKFPLIHYFVKEGNAQGYYILCCRKSDQKPYMRLDFLSKGISVTRLDESGIPLPYKLANLETLDPTHPLYAYTLRFAPPDKIRCFIDESSQEIGELHFPELNLSFQKKDRNGLESQEFPGFFLAPLDIKALKSHSRDAMVLRNAEGEIKILLPVPKAEKKKLGFDKKTEGETSFGQASRYFVFDLDSLDAPLKCKNVSEKLFLIYFYKVHGDFEAAYAELKKLHALSFDDSAIQILKLFLFLRDRTPLSLAFTQKLLLFFIDHLHLIEGYSKKKPVIETESAESDSKKDVHKSEIDSFLGMAIAWYEEYLRAASNDIVNGIPVEWRLTEEEECRILSTLQRTKIEPPKILNIRAELLLAENRSAEIEFIPQEISLAPAPLEKVLSPSSWKSIHKLSDWEKLPFGKAVAGRKNEQQIAFPNQVSDTYCARFFVELYEKACKVPSGCAFDPFDFTLLALLRSSPVDSNSHELASLLFYVRLFPDYFGKISLAKWNDAKNIKTAFNSLIETVERVALLPSVQERIEKLTHKKEAFPYQKKTTLTLPPKTHALPQMLTSVDVLHINTKPFESCRKSLFTAHTGPSSYGKEKLFESSLLDDHPIEKEIVEKYEKAYRSLAEQKKTSYVFHAEKISKARGDLKARRQEYLSLIQQEEKRILDSVNNPFDTFKGDFTLAEEREFRLRQNAHQTYSITPEMIMQEVILKNTTILFEEHRSMLNKEHVKAIVDSVHRYYHLLVLSSLCTEALDLLEKAEKKPGDVSLEQELLNILNYEFLYSPEKFPEIAYMKVKTGKLPRKEQALVYQWVCEGLELNENRLFQLSAGGGKTSYLIPLMILRSQRHKLVPFVLSTQAMYGIEKENLKNTLSLLGIELDTLEIGMGTKLTVDNLQVIYHQLVSDVQKGKALIITPQTYYALCLSYFTSAINQDEEASLLLQKILAFLKKRALLLGDESHRNFDPMTQAIFGLGDFINLAKKEQALLMALAKPLLGIQTHVCKNGQKLADVALSKESGKAKPSKQEIQLIQKELAQHILDTFFKFIPVSEHEKMIEFWTDKKRDEPAYLSTLDHEQRYLILLARYFFVSLLKQVVKMKTDFDHMLSPEQGDIDTPSYFKTPSHAQFKDPFLTFFLSIKGTCRRGLNQDQFRKLIEHLKKQDIEEQTLALNIEQTPTQERFKKWVEAKFPTLTLKNVDLTNRALFDELFDFCSKTPAILEYYLHLFVFSRVGYSSEQFTSSPAHLMDGFKCSVIFSATPLSKIAYPRALQGIHNDDLFETQVIAQSAKSKNQNHVFPENIDDFLSHISIQRQKYAHVRHMIDAGGFLCHEANRDIAERWLAHSDLDGVVFFKDGVEAYEEKLCFCLKNSSINIQFSRMEELKEELAKLRLNIDDLKIGVFFDAAHAESAHFDPQAKSAAFIFAGDDLTLSHAIQGIMRERGFLNEAIDQQIIWVVQKDLKAKMQGKCREFTNSIIHTWCLKNEVRSKKTKIVMAAFQEIIFKIEQYSQLLHVDQQHAIQTHIEGYREKVTPHAAWGAQKKVEETDTVLWQFAKTHYTRFGFPIEFDANIELKNAIAQTIQDVHQKISHIVTNFHKHAVSEMHQKCVVKKQMRTIQYQQTPTDVQPEPVSKHIKIKNKNYPSAMKKHLVPIREIFKTPHLTENFYIESNQIATAKRHGKHLKEKYLKTIDFILIVIHKDKIWAEGISNDVLPKYIKHLQKNSSDKNILHQAFIIRADGVLYQRGTGVLAPPEAKVNAILKSNWLQDVLIDAALLKGKILYTEQFKKRVESWPDFMEFWNKILTALPLKKEISVHALLSYLPALELGA